MPSNKLVASLWITASAGLGLLVAPTTSQADIAEQPGTICVAGKSDAGKINYSPQYGVFNDDTANPARVYCPHSTYQRDQFASLDVTAYLTVFDQNGTTGKDVVCDFYVLWNDGIIGYKAPQQKTTGSLATAQYIEFSDIPNSWFSNGNPTNLSCSIPAKTSTGKQSRVTAMGFYMQD